MGYFKVVRDVVGKVSLGWVQVRASFKTAWMVRSESVQIASIEDMCLQTGVAATANIVTRISSE